jgi:Alpha/beta hydrolase domain
LFPNFPVATQADGSPIVGLQRREFSPQEAASFTSSIVTGFQPEETADTNTARSTLTVRDREDAPRVTVPSDRWAFGRCPTGRESLTPSTRDICLFGGFDAQRIYELIYPAKNPKVMGLAYAVVRDVGSFFRYETRDEAGTPNPLTADGPLRHGYSSGTSSTGMYQRDFLYLGFNEDEAHRKVFDGVTIYSAATHRLFANVEFAHPTYFSGQDQHHDYTSNSIPPFTFAVTTDPISGIRDGILKRPATDPVVIQMDEELVFWQWKASLNVVDGRGHPVPVPDNVRLYFQNGLGHIAASGLLAPPAKTPDGRAGECVHPRQGGPSNLAERAMAVAMDNWVDRGIEPPKSAYPRLEDKTLVSLEDYRAAFPRIPGMTPPTVMNTLTELQFGATFDSKGGEQTLLPPTKGRGYMALVPKPDEDGVGIGGIRTIHTRAPLGTNVGWNLRPGSRAPDLCSLAGSYVPFAKTRAERIANGDSRKSLEERYKDHAGFVKAVTQAVTDLVKERFMLEEDAQTFIHAAETSDILR